ncbi:MAG TPA: glycosyltransferase [Elusimicrobiota bacterium]|nr:glycosyltransferase [Elusimicrobiota bacterium]
MKTIQALGWYFPEASGGTEVYVDGLARELRTLGVEGVVAAPRLGDAGNVYEHHAIPVYRYPVAKRLSVAQIRGQVPPDGFDVFARWLQAQTADVYHQHSWTTGCGIHHLRQARRQGCRTVVTVHVPGNVCLRGTMMLQGQSPCDGFIREDRCGVCWAGGQGAPSLAAQVAAGLPAGWRKLAVRVLPDSGLSTLLSLPELVGAHRNGLLEMAELSDRVVAVCQWLYDALAANGVPRSKLVLSRQGISEESMAAEPSAPARPGDGRRPLRLGYLGRWDPVKGVHVLVRAIRQLPPSVSMQLTIHALNQGDLRQSYQNRVLAEMAGDPRIRIAQPLAREEVLKTLAMFDALVVPSQWLETGPLVVLEAQAAGIPVLGSRLGGIAELVQPGINGELVAASDIEAWAAALRRWAENPAAVRAMRGSKAPVRTMKEAAADMARLYQEILR